VGSIDESVTKVLENGGSIVLDKRPMMDFAYFAIIQDIDGNRIGLMEYRN
jgi:predicted enzyme related to lactoylglutathione lyase